MAAKRTKLSEQVRQALNGCGLTRYRVWKETGISQVALSRFVNGERGLPMKTLDRLADFLDLNITTGADYPAKAARTPHSNADTGRAVPRSGKRPTRQKAGKGKLQKGK